MKRKLLITVFICISIVAFSQSCNNEYINKYKFPVVVHIMHFNDEAYGSGHNISYNQIKSQIDAINCGYNKAYPLYNGFANGQRAEDVGFEFYLATIDNTNDLNWAVSPNGQVEYGVVRHSLDRNNPLQASLIGIGRSGQIGTSTVDDFYNLTNPNGAFTQNYINIFVGDLDIPGHKDFLLDAAFNLIFENINIDYHAFGDNSAFFNAFPSQSNYIWSSVASHELGHFFGLSHLNKTCADFNPDGSPILIGSGCSGGLCDLPANLPGESIGYTCPNVLAMPENFMALSQGYSTLLANTFTKNQKEAMINAILSQSNLINLHTVSNQQFTGIYNNANAYGGVKKAVDYSFLSCSTVNFFVSNNFQNCSVTWQFGDGQVGTGININHAYANDGNYNVVAIVIDNASSSQKTFNFNVNIISQLNILTDTIKLCEVGCQYLQATNNDHFLYEWKSSNLNNLINGSTTNHDVFVAVNQSGEVKLFLNNKNNTCFLTESVFVDIVSTPTISNLPDLNLSCNSQINVAPVILGGTVPYQYSWQNDGNYPNYNTPSINITAQNSATFFLKVTDSNGCLADSFFQVSTPMIETPVLTYNSAPCVGDDFNVNVTNPNANYLYNWHAYSSGMLIGSQTGIQFSAPTLTASIDVVFEAVYNNCVYTQTIQVSSGYHFELNSNCNTLFTSIQNMNCASGTDVIKWEIIDNGHVSVIEANSQNPSAFTNINLQPQIHIVQFDITSLGLVLPINSVNQSLIVNLFVNNVLVQSESIVRPLITNPISVSLPNDFSVPLGSTLNLNAATNANAIAWVNQSGGFLDIYGNSSPSPSIVSSSSSLNTLFNGNVCYGVYAFYPQFSSSSNNTCVSYDDVCITTPTICLTSPTLSVTPSSSLFCTGNSYSLTASGATSYTWTSGTFTSTANPLIGNTSIASNYTIELKGSNQAGCVSTLLIPVSVVTSPTLLVSSSSKKPKCAGSLVALSASGALTYTWSSIGLNSNSSAINVSPNATSVYSLQGANSNGCISSVTHTLLVLPNPSISINPFNLSFCVGSSSSLTASGATSYTWSSGSFNSVLNPLIYSPSVSGNYTISVTGRDNNFCTSTFTNNVLVKPNPQISITASNKKICNGSCVSIVASGANSYTWSAGSNSSSIYVCPTSSTVYSVTGTGLNSCINSNTISILVTNCMSASNYQNAHLAIDENDISVYPNPASDFITITNSHDIEKMELYDSYGKFQLEIDSSQIETNKIIVSDFVNGIYFIKITIFSGNVFNYKVLINH